MPSVVLSDRLITKTLAKHRASPKRQRMILRDATLPGLRLVLGKHGATWAFTRTIREGTTRKEAYLTIGPLAAVPLSQARQRAAALRDDLVAGRDPVAEARLGRARETTLEIEAARWTPRGKPQTQALEALNLSLALRDRNVLNAAPEALKAAAIVAMLDKHRSKPASARNRFHALKRFCDHLVETGSLKQNPCSEVPRRAIPRPPPSRSTYPSAAEVRGLWTAAATLPDVQRDFVRLALLLPLRRSELSGLTRAEVDLDAREVRLAASRMKAARAFVMPLSAAVLDILRPRLHGLKPDDLVLPLKAADATMFNFQAFLSKLRKLSGATTFKLHDTRRLFVSECAEHHVGDLDLLDSLLAHSQSASRGGVLGVYQRSKRAGERRRVVEEWAKLVGFAVEHGAWPRERGESAEVVPLRRPIEKAAPQSAASDAVAFVPVYQALKGQGWSEAEIATTFGALYGAAIAAGLIVPARVA